MYEWSEFVGMEYICWKGVYLLESSVLGGKEYICRKEESLFRMSVLSETNKFLASIFAGQEYI